MKAIAAALLLLPALALAQATVAVPRLLPYQGRLLKTDGTPEAGSPRLTFCVYGAATGGSALWCEDQTVPLRNGFYAIFLGAERPFEASLFDGSARWLGVAVDGATEMTPRQQIASVAYAITATYALQAANAGNSANAGRAEHAATADYATSAKTADNANHAASADTVTTVLSAVHATSAETASSAKLADRALKADSAATATTYAGEEELKKRVTALEQPGPAKEVFGYVSPQGVLAWSGPSGGVTVTVHRVQGGLYEIQGLGTGIGDGALVVTRETIIDDFTNQHDDLYAIVHREDSDRFRVVFISDGGDWTDTGWYFQIRMR